MESIFFGIFEEPNRIFFCVKVGEGVNRKGYSNPRSVSFITAAKMS